MQHNKRNKKNFTGYILALFITAFICSGAFLAISFTQRQLQEKELDKFSETFYQIVEKNEISAEEEKANFYKELKEKNADFSGWIYIEGTPVNYPVMRNGADSEYYLRRNFEKKYSVYGIPFIDSKCDSDFANNDNIIIYGHYVDNGNMFGSLGKYKEKEYLREHNEISFDTINEEKQYEIISVFVTQDVEGGFPYYEFIKAKDKAEYDTYVEKIKRLSLHETEVEAQHGKQLLTLSTCDYSVKNGRLVVVAVEN